MGDKIKILAVDDERQNTTILREILSFYPKYRLTTVSSGEETFAVLDNVNPDIILLDIMMPGMNGYEVCKRIRKMKRKGLAKIIMISGLSLVDDRLKAYEAGADDYISKPFVEDELIAKLEVFSKLSRMEEVDELKTTALNMLSHETRTPLNGIFLSLDLLSEEVKGNLKAERYVDMLRLSSGKLKFLLEKISRYCEVKSGLQIKNSLNTNIKTALNSLIEEVQSHSGNKVEFVFNCDEGAEIYTDWNLFSEAVKEVLLKAVSNSEESDKIWLSYYDDEKLSRLIIEDEGELPTKDEDRIIFRGLYTPNVLNHSSGLGLSLAISDAIIEVLGGEIELDHSVSHGGSKFTVTIKKVENM